MDVKAQCKPGHIVNLPHVVDVVSRAFPPSRICSQLCLTCSVLAFHHSRNSVKILCGMKGSCVNVHCLCTLARSFKCSVHLCLSFLSLLWCLSYSELPVNSNILISEALISSVFGLFYPIGVKFNRPAWTLYGTLQSPYTPTSAIVPDILSVPIEI